MIRSFLRTSLFLLVLALVAMLTGCAHYVVTDPAAVADSAIRVNGLGAVVPRADLTHSQQRLMAMRASRVDAYRNLVERIYGLEVAGNSTVRQMATEHDQIRSFVQHVIRGAVVVDIALIDDNTYQTTLELQLGRQFYNCLNSPLHCVDDPLVPVNAMLYPARAVGAACSGAHCVHGQHYSFVAP